MKNLYLLRHAKALSGLPTEDDHARALAPQGIEQAHALGSYLRGQNACFSHTLCSTALRTRQTLEALEESYGASLQAEICDTLYHASANQLIQLLRTLPEKASDVLIIGHNPGIHQLASMLAIEGNREALEESTLHYPPCTLASFSLSIADWGKLKPYCGQIHSFLTPDMLSQLTMAA